MGIRKLARLKRDLKRFGITQDAVAANVRPEPVTRTHVCHVLNDQIGRYPSQPVVESAEELIRAAQQQHSKAS